MRTSRIAYRKQGKENLYPQDAELNWGEQAYSAGIIGRNAEAAAAAPFGQAAAQVSAQGAIHLGKRQSEELAVAAAADFEAFYAARRPVPRDPATGLLLTADGSAFPVLPGALRPATAKAAAASSWPDDPGDLRKSRKRMAELAAVADIPPAPRTPGDIRAALYECADYLEHKQDHLDYPAFLAAGWPVASGLIEGAARWIVKDRLEVTGARWGLDGAEAVLKLRALHGTGDLGDYHFQQEKHRNHDSRYQQAQELAA